MDESVAHLYLCEDEFEFFVCAWLKDSFFYSSFWRLLSHWFGKIQGLYVETNGRRGSIIVNIRLILIYISVKLPSTHQE